MKVFITENKTSFRLVDRVIDLTPSETKCEISLYDSGKRVCYIDYILFDDVLHVKSIKSIKNNARYAKVLINKFFNKYSNKKIQSGWLSNSARSYLEELKNK